MNLICESINFEKFQLKNFTDPKLTIFPMQQYRDAFRIDWNTFTLRISYIFINYRQRIQLNRSSK